MKKAKIIGLISIVVMVAVLVIQFLPFWYYEGTSTSIQMYVWFPEKCKSLTKLLQEILGKSYAVGNIVLGPIALLVGSVVGIVLSVLGKKGKPILAKAVPMVCGIVGVYGFLSQPALQLGSNWVLYLILSILLALVCGVAAVLEILYGKRSK